MEDVFVFAIRILGALCAASCTPSSICMPPKETDQICESKNGSLLSRRDAHAHAHTNAHTHADRKTESQGRRGRDTGRWRNREIERQRDREKETET